MACDIRREASFQRLAMFRWQKTDFHVIIDDPLQRHPPGSDSQRVADLLGDYDLALMSYYMCHSMTPYSAV